MKKLLLILCIIFSFNCLGQDSLAYPNKLYTKNTWEYLDIKKGIGFPNDTFPVFASVYKKVHMAFKDTVLYRWDTTEFKWKEYFNRVVGTGSGTDNVNAGSGFRLLKPDQSIKTLYQGNGITFDSTSNANGITGKLDTTIGATVDRLNKETAILDAEKLDKVDTIGKWMGSAYKRSDSVFYKVGSTEYFAYKDTAGAGTNNINVGSTFKLLNESGQTIKSISAGDRTGFDSTATTVTITSYDSVASTSIKNISDLRATGYHVLTARKKNSNDIPTIDVQGYTLAGDGGKSKRWWCDTCTITDDGGYSIKPTSVSGAGRWILEIDNSTINTKQYGVSESNTGSDNRDRMVKLLAFAKTYPSLCRRIFVDKGNYSLSDSLLVDFTIEIVGTGSGYDGSGFSFPADKKGLRVTGAKPSFFNLFFSGSKPPTGYDSSKHGITVNCETYMRNVKAINFGGIGFYIYGEGLDSPPSNTDHARFEYCYSESNGVHGFYTRGGDANIITFDQCEARDNNAGGFIESGFLGNHYENCHSVGNSQWNTGYPRSLAKYGGTVYQALQTGFLGRPDLAPGKWHTNNELAGWIGSVQIPDFDSARYFFVGGAYNMDGENSTVSGGGGENQFTHIDNCYSEGGMPYSYAGDKVIVTAGDHATPFREGTVMTSFSKKLNVRTAIISGFAMGDSLFTQMSEEGLILGGNANNSSKGLGIDYDTLKHIIRFRDVLSYGTPPISAPMAIGGFTSTASDWGRTDNDQRGNFLIKDFILFRDVSTASDYKLFSFHTEIPTTGNFKRGDFRLYAQPTSRLSPAGFRNITGGSPGTWDTVGWTPSGGTTGQILTKSSNTAFDYYWAAPSAGGTVTDVSANDPIQVANPTTTPIISLDTTRGLPGAVVTHLHNKKTEDSLGALFGSYTLMTRTITTNAPLTGGGDLSANRTFGIDTARSTNNLTNHGRVKQMIDSLGTLIGGGSVTGSGTAGQGTYWNGTSTITGNTNFLVDPTSAAPYYFNTSNSSPLGGTYFQNARFYAPNAANGNIMQFLFGKEDGTNNAANFAFNYVSTGSTSNSLRLGFYGNDDLFRLFGTGNVSIDGSDLGEKLYVNGGSHIGGRHSAGTGYYGGLASPHASAVLQAQSTTKGFLPPVGTAAQMNAITTPATGLIFINSDSIGVTNSGVFVYDGSGWRQLMETRRDASAGYTTLSQFVGESNWQMYHSNGSGDITPFTVGAANTALLGNGVASAPTWGTVPNAALTNSTISGIALGSNLADLTATDATLTFSGTYNGSVARTIGINLGNANTWTADQTVPAEAYDATGWNGSNEVPTKNDVRDKIESMSAGGLTVGTTTITGGTNTRILYNNAGVLGEKKLPGNINTNYTDVGNITTGVDDLMNYSIPAGQLATDGDYLEFTMTFDLGANANSKQIQVVFGGTTVYATGAQTQNDGILEIKGTIIRTGAATQRITFSQQNNTTLFTDYANYVTSAETLSGAITLKATGEGVATDDIIQKILLVKYIPVN